MYTQQCKVASQLSASLALPAALWLHIPLRYGQEPSPGCHTRPPNPRHHSATLQSRPPYPLPAPRHWPVLCLQQSGTGVNCTWLTENRRYVMQLVHACKPPNPHLKKRSLHLLLQACSTKTIQQQNQINKTVDLMSKSSICSIDRSIAARCAQCIQLHPSATTKLTTSNHQITTSNHQITTSNHQITTRQTRRSYTCQVFALDSVAVLGKAANP